MNFCFNRNHPSLTFDIVFTPTHLGPIPAHTQIYRLDLVYVLRNLNIDDPRDEAMFYEFKQLSGDLFRVNVLSGLISLASEWQPDPANKLHEHRLQFSLVKSLQLLPDTQAAADSSLEGLVFTARVIFDVGTVDARFLPRPVLATRSVSVYLRGEATRDQFLLARVDAYLLNSNASVASIYKVEYRLEPANLPFYIEVTTGNLYFNSLLAIDLLDTYKLFYVVQFFYQNERVHELSVRVNVLSGVSSQRHVSRVSKPTNKLASGNFWFLDQYFIVR